MDDREFERRKREIEEKYRLGLAKLQSDRDRRLKVLNEFRELFPDESSPDNLLPTSSPASPGERTSNGNGTQASFTKQQLTQKEQVLLAVGQVDGDVITQPIVLAKLAEIAPEVAEKIHPTNISKILKGLQEDGRLKLVRKTHASQPTVYRRIVNM